MAVGNPGLYPNEDVPCWVFMFNGSIGDGAAFFTNQQFNHRLHHQSSPWSHIVNPRSHLPMFDLWDYTGFFLYYLLQRKWSSNQQLHRSSLSFRCPFCTWKRERLGWVYRRMPLIIIIILFITRLSVYGVPLSPGTPNNGTESLNQSFSCRNLTFLQVILPYNFWTGVSKGFTGW